MLTLKKKILAFFSILSIKRKTGRKKVERAEHDEKKIFGKKFSPTPRSGAYGYFRVDSFNCFSLYVCVCVCVSVSGVVFFSLP